MIDLSVIVLSWNTRDDLRRCLDSLRREVDAAPCESTRRRAAASRCTEPCAEPTAVGARGTAAAVEVVVVDNASTDGSPEMVAAEYPWVRLVQNRANVGFSAGNNLGVAEAHGRYLLLLNSDTDVRVGALEQLVAFAESHPRAGIVGARLLNRDGSLQYSCRSFPTLATGFFRDTPLGRLFPRNRFNRDYLLTDWDHRSARPVDWVSGAAMVLRRETLDRIGGLDERFFMYCEDVDLCYRARQDGWDVWYCPDAEIVHLIARSSDKNVTAMLIERHRSMWRFFRKHYAATARWWVWPIVWGGLVARGAVMVVKNRIDRWRQSRAEARAARLGGGDA